jgi:hypothetical protein
VIRTSAEHPLYVQGKGWTAAAMLAPGDLFRSHDGCWNPVESISLTGEMATVYNMRIAEYHTCFVGSAEWGFSVWGHNACNSAKPEWSTYPSGVPRPPQGALKLAGVTAYATARKAANAINGWIRKILGSAVDGKEIHEILPVRFGGSPTEIANKIALSAAKHNEVTAWRNKLMWSMRR